MIGNKQEKIILYLINEMFDFSLLTNVWISSYGFAGHESTRIKHMHLFCHEHLFQMLENR
jgi:hypothetical protein